MKPLVRVLIGPPGVGKTSICAQRIAAGQFGKRLSLDEARGLLGEGEHDQSVTQAAVELVTKQAADLLAAGEEVTIDATSSTDWERARWINLAREHGARVVAMLLRAPLDIVLARNARRARPVPEDVVREMWARIAAVTYEDLINERFDGISVIDTSNEMPQEATP